MIHVRLDPTTRAANCWAAGKAYKAPSVHRLAVELRGAGLPDGPMTVHEPNRPSLTIQSLWSLAAAVDPFMAPSSPASLQPIYGRSDRTRARAAAQRHVP